MPERSVQWRRASAMGVAAVVSTAALAADWVEQNSGGDTLYGVHFVDESTGYAVGAGGVILKTVDGGSSWPSQTSGTTSDLRAVRFPLDDQTGWAVGLDGTIITTSNGGASWSDQSPAKPVDLYDVQFPGGELTGYAVGDSATVMKTVDGGASWFNESVPAGVTGHMRGLHFPLDASTGWAVGTGGRIIKRTGAIMATGTYTGDGIDGRAISGLGFSPDVVIIKADAAQTGVLRISTMAGDASKQLTGAAGLVSGRIKSMGDDGFTVGAHAQVNANGTVYHWAAWDAVAGELSVGTYTGNGKSNHAVTAGLAIGYIIVAGENVSAPWQRMADMSTDNSTDFGATAETAGRIKSFAGINFKVGSDSEVNQDGQTFHFAAWADVAGKIHSGTYTGDGTGSREIGGVGFQPQFVLIKSRSAAETAMRPESIVAAETASALAVAHFANGVTNLRIDGLEVGSDSRVNANGDDYFYAAFGGGWAAQTSGTTETLWDVHFPTDGQTGFAVGEDTTVLKTTDGGSTWVEQTSGTGLSLHAVHFPVDATIGYTVADGGTISRSEDGGASWGDEGTSTIAELWDVHFPVTAVTGWAVGASETILIPVGGVFVLTGRYYGDGTDDRAITGPGFRPDFVIIKGDGRGPVARTSSMAGDVSKKLGTTGGLSLQADLIQSLDADGFTVGADDLVNESGTLFFWMAFGGDGALGVGSYAGDGADDRSIPIGFQPDHLIVMAEQNAAAVQRFDTMSGDESSDFGNSTPGADMIQAVQADGFQVGTDESVNRVAYTYHYVAFMDRVGQVASGSYSGDGWDDRSITGLGFRPEYVIIKSAAADGPVHRPRAIGTRDTSFDFGAGTAFADRIQALEEDGFQVGSDVDVNRNGTTYHWVAFSRDAGQPVLTPWVLQWMEADPLN